LSRLQTAGRSWLMAKNGVEGVYTAIPAAVGLDAEFIPEITHKDALTVALQWMDSTACAVACSQQAAIHRVQKLDDGENIDQDLVSGEAPWAQLVRNMIRRTCS